MNEKRKYDSTIARIAGNLLSGRKPGFAGDQTLFEDDVQAIEWAVKVARTIVAEVERTELKAEG